MRQRAQQLTGSCLAAMAGLGIGSLSGAEPLKIEGAPRHPTVFVTPENVQRARENIARYPWAQQIAGVVLKEAQTWLARDDAWIRGVVPAPGAAFSYGVTGCPACGTFWGPWGSEAGSFDHPGTLICKNGHRLPDAKFPDSGTGYVAPDGRIHYIVGTYNAWVMEQLTFKGLESLVHAYSFTGEERYAAKAAVILDAIAAIYPSCHKGCWDYPTIPPSGRLNRPWYQASRVLIHFVDQYDQLFNSPALDLPSITPGLSRRRNIEDNLLKDGGAYCYSEAQPGQAHCERGGRHHNGQADYQRGALAVGVCLGIPEYIRWAVDGPVGLRAILANSIGRDGDYFEVTATYSDHTRELFFTFAEPLRNYRGSVYPEGLDLYRDPKFVSFLAPHNLPIYGTGHMPRYGDSPPDLQKRDMPERPFDRSDYDFLEKLYVRTARPEFGALLHWLANGRIDWLRGLESTGDPSGKSIAERRRTAGISIYREPGDQFGGGFSDRMWMVFNAGEPPKAGEGLPANWARRLLASDFQGQKGLAILRTGEKDAAQALFLRFGPSLNHGHRDNLNFNYFARGYELTYDLGYSSTAATQTQSSWAKQTASHNLVVVNEQTQPASDPSGGSLTMFADTPVVQLVEATSELSYRSAGVAVYRRTAALVGSGEDTYLVDLFRVRGGHQHDWIFHARSEDIRLTGVKLGSPAPGSLAGPDIDWSGQQLSDGDIAGHANVPYWIAPPGNGYGFLGRPARGQPTAPWCADWTLDPQTRLRVCLPADGIKEVCDTLANGLYPHHPKARFLVVRRSGENLDSQFLAAIEPYGDKPRNLRNERLAVEGPTADIAPVAMKVTGVAERVDYVYSSADALTRRADGLALAGCFIHARQRAGKLETLTLIGARQWTGMGWNVMPGTDGWRGAVAALDLRENTFTTDMELPADGSLDGAMIAFSNPGYSRNTTYRIVRVERVGRQSRVIVSGSFLLGIGEVATVDSARRTFTSCIPHEYAYSDGGNGEQSFFRGKRISTANGVSTTVRALQIAEPLLFTVENADGFKPGDRFEYADVQAGDRFEILSTCTIRQVAPGRYRVTGSTPAKITAPAGMQIEPAPAAK